MIKILIGVLLTVLSTFMGYKLSNKFQLRRKYYQALCSFNRDIKAEIAYAKNSIVYLINKLTESDFKKTMHSLLESKEGKSEIFFPNYIKDEDKDFIKSYLRNIGRTDSISQGKYLNSVTNKIDDLLLQAEKAEKDYKTLYIKLGFLFGLALFILII